MRTPRLRPTRTPLRRTVRAHFVCALVASLIAAALPVDAWSMLLANDAHVLGVIGIPGQQDVYTFTATAGDGVALALVDSSDSLNPRLVVDDPDGINLFDFAHGVGTHWTQALSKTGTYTVTVSAGAAQTGTYSLRYVKAPGANEHGSLPNDSRVVKAIALGDLDTYTFGAVAGDSVVLSLVDSSGTLNPSLTVYDPTGAQIYFNFHGAGVLTTLALSSTGTYTILVNAGIGQTGVADLYFVRAPGANEHGKLVDEVTVTSDLDLGDLDSYVFDAKVGDNIELTLNDVSGTLNVNMKVFRPDGSLLFDGGHGVTVSLVHEVASDGQYVVVIHGAVTQTGIYSLLFTTDAPPEPVPTAAWWLSAFALMLAGGARLARVPA